MVPIRHVRATPLAALVALPLVGFAEPVSAPLGLVAPGAASDAAISAPVSGTDNRNRDAVEAFYRAYFADDTHPAMRWDGSDTGGDAGTVSTGFLRAVLRRINAYRAFSGLPGDVVLIDSWNRSAQEAAFMTSHRDWISHLVTAKIPFYTEGAGEAVRHSNIVLGETGPAGVDRFIEDRGGHNFGVGHRRWLLHPPNKYMGVGAVPFRGKHLREALFVWVVGGGVPMPERRAGQPVLWPCAGYFPLPLVPERWSLSYPGADFSGAVVQARLDGEPIPATLEPPARDTGENTLVWRFDTLSRIGFRDGMTFDIRVDRIQFDGEPVHYRWRTVIIRPEFPAIPGF